MERERENGRGKEGQKIFIHQFTSPNSYNSLGWVKLKSGARCFFKSFTCLQRPEHLGQPLLPSQATNRELAQKWNSHDMDWHPDLMSVLKVEAVPTHRSVGTPALQKLLGKAAGASCRQHRLHPHNLVLRTAGHVSHGDKAHASVFPHTHRFKSKEQKACHWYYLQPNSRFFVGLLPLNRWHQLQRIYL